MIITIDGQQFPLPDEIAAQDDLLKAALAPFVPWIVNARIERTEKDGATVVNVVKRADWKGCTLTEVTLVSEVEGNSAVIAALIASPDEMNPAVALWQQLQARTDLNDPAVVLAFEPTLHQAIEQGERDIAAVQQALARLAECAPAPATRIPLGF
jgi:hypothetical protein